jgi:hypothetical protein
MSIRIKDLPFEANPSPIDLIAIHDDSSGEERNVSLGSIALAVESEVIDRIVKVQVEDEGVRLNPTGVSTINFTGPGVTATPEVGDPNYANVLIRDKIVTNLLYVSEDGDDANDGLTLDSAKGSIRSALRAAGQFYTYEELAQAPTDPNIGTLTLNPQRHFNLLKDAGNQIGANREFIVEECWAYALTQITTPFFINNPVKGKRDLGTVLDSIVADMKNGGNLSTVRAGQAFYNKAGALDYIDTILSETSTALAYLRNLMVAAMRNWDWVSRCNITAASNNVTVLDDLGTIGFLEGMQIPSLGRTVTRIVDGTTLQLDAPAGTTANNTQLLFELPAGGGFGTGFLAVKDLTLPDDVGHLNRGETECSSVAHAVLNFFGILNTVLTTSKDAVTTSLPPEGVTVFVKAGSYLEENPLEVHANSSVIGDNLRIVTVKPLNLEQDLFHVNNGSYIAGMSFRTVDNVDFPKAIVAFPEASGAGQIYESPYVQNCTNFCPLSTGLKVDGSRSLGLKSMVLDAFTQFNPGGIGCHLLNQGYTQLVSMFTICSDKSVFAESGGSCSLTNSNSDFGIYGLFSEGLSPLLLEYTVFGNYQDNAFEYLIRGADLENFPPYQGLVGAPKEVFYVVSEVRVNSPGSGYVDEPTVVFEPPEGVQGITAEALATTVSGVVTAIEVLSEGGQYTLSQTEDYEDPIYGKTRKVLRDSEYTINHGVGSGLEVKVFMEPVFYTVKKVERLTGLTPPTFKVEFEENIPFPVEDGDSIQFYQPSFIVSSSHTFEFVGGGTDLLSALPAGGATFNPDNEAISLNGGRVAVTSSDQGGNFRIGEGIFINSARGEIQGEDFERSLFSIMSPFIIALGE